MQRTLSYFPVIPSYSNTPLTIKGYLKSRGYSAQNLKILKQLPDGILLNGAPAHMNARLSLGDTLTVQIKEEASSENIVPVKLPLNIVYEDEDLLVVNKPAGMPIHPSQNNYDNTLANALAYYFQQKGESFVFRCIGRLDRDTSGLTVIAKHFVSAGILGDLVAEKTLRTRGDISSSSMPNHATTFTPESSSNNQCLLPLPPAPEAISPMNAINAEISSPMSSDFHRNQTFLREYLAIVRGPVIPSSGTITAPLGRKPGSIIERCVDFENGEPAVTHYRVVEEKNGYSLVSLILGTGRTHQIRIHMKYIGHPLIGDYLYNPENQQSKSITTISTAEKVEANSRISSFQEPATITPSVLTRQAPHSNSDIPALTRQALHSHRLSFPHPMTGQPLEFVAPLPEDMQKLLS